MSASSEVILSNCSVFDGVGIQDDAGGVRPAVIVQLAGPVALVETDCRDFGNGAVPTALGGRSRTSSPSMRGPLP